MNKLRKDGTGGEGGGEMDGRCKWRWCRVQVQGSQDQGEGVRWMTGKEVDGLSKVKARG